jgi:thioredoxin-related protein
MPMKCLNSLLLLASLLATSSHAANWSTDLEAAKAQAARESKHVMINFTGSDWCGWCMRLKQEVFSQPEFESFAAKNLVLVEIDFPKRKQIPQATLRANAQIADRFKVTGYPSLVFLNPAGKETGRTGYQPGGAKAFVQAVGKSLGVKSDPGEAPTALTAEPVPREPVPDLPLFGGAPPAPPQHFDDIVLKTISGTKERRFAMLNNTTFAPGDTAKVKLQNGDVKVRCLEIRDKSVIVAVDGQTEPREIKLRTIR